MDVKLGGENDNSASIKPMSRFAADQEIFRGVLTNIQAKAGVAALKKKTNSDSSGVSKAKWFSNSFGGPVNRRVAYLG